MDPEKKSLNFIFPTKYVIPKSLKFSHWLSEKAAFFSFLRFFDQEEMGEKPFPKRWVCSFEGSPKLPETLNWMT